ncbi:MAG: hypothetical protein HUJ26_09960 [Planctomycetaceae bacterium]|nr:hypothetical protein [Planctomycetaceae bacterium]
MLETTAELAPAGPELSKEEIAAQLLKTLPQHEATQYYQSFSLTSVEQSVAQVQIGQQESVITGQSRSFPTRGGQPTRSNVYQNQHTGSMLTVQGRIHKTGQIAVELNFTSSRLEKIAAPPNNDQEVTTLPPKTLTLTSESTVIVEEGVPQVVFHSTETRDGKRVHSLLILTAEIQD